MKLDNKGFTVVELLASFSLTMIITTLLFEVVLTLKDIYVSSELETAIKNENALVAREINRQINNGNIPIECSGNACTLSGGEQIFLSSNTTIQIGNRKFDMPDGAYIQNESISQTCSQNDASLPVGNENCYLQVSYTVTSEGSSDDVEFNLVTSYLG